MRASSGRRGLGLRGKRSATVLIGLLAAIAVIVALPTAAGGADRHAFRDAHHTKGFWRAATLKRATLRAAPAGVQVQERQRALRSR